MFIIYTLFLFLNIINCYNIPLQKNNINNLNDNNNNNNNINKDTKVFLHLEKFNERYNLLHIGISFSNNIHNIRYDFRPYSEAKGYLTTNMDRQDFSNIFPELEINSNFEEQYRRYRDDIIFDTKDLQTKNIIWGYTNYSFDEIIHFEKTLHKKYRVGIYDCRHYVKEFTKWSVNKPTPIWRLHKIWNYLE